MEQEKSFDDCTLTFLEKTFDLEEMTSLPVLTDWLNGSSFELTRIEQKYLVHLQKLLAFNIRDWNEVELAMNFIGPVFSLANFSSKQYNLFAQRSVEATINGWKLHGKPDNMIASGRRVPEIPFFAFQEYKKQKDPKGDPAAQALAAMLVGQALNEQVELPIYGSYVIGNDWYFCTLENKKFAISRDFSAITDDIFTIFRILKALKEIVKKRFPVINY